jgi:threonine/homoserine/homoserine lactone efflux protein
MYDWTTFLTFVVAGAAIIIAPGPAQALVLARTLGDGRKAGAMTVFGLNAATVVHALVAGVGLSQVVARSALAFAVMKYLGAAYLVYLGVDAFFSAPATIDAQSPSSMTVRAALVRAFITGILNPKVILFFMAFLPQFVRPERGAVLLQFLFLGALLGLMDIVYELGLVFLAAKATGRFGSNRARAWRVRVTGAVLIGLAVMLAFAG